MKRVAALVVLCAAAAGEEPFHERVNRAIDDGVAWLQRSQEADGSWGVIRWDQSYSGDDEIYPFPSGPTSLTLLTLLKCGVAPDDPVVKRGLDVLRFKHSRPRSTYEIAMAMLAVEALYNPYKKGRKVEEVAQRRGRSEIVELPKQDRLWMKALTKGLVKRFNDGGWRYGGEKSTVRNPFGIRRDMSHTQFAMMALYVAHRCGVKVDKRVVEGAVRWTLGEQERTGPAVPRHVPGATGGSRPTDRARGWAYCRESPELLDTVETGSMTTGGIVVLLTGRSMLEDLSPATARRLEGEIDRAVADGLAWLDNNWRVETNPPEGSGAYHFLYLWGLERVGDLLGRDLIGEHDWYREGAELLLRMQEKDGHWTRLDTVNPQGVLNTCFALLFLDRATMSVVTAKREKAR